MVFAAKLLFSVALILPIAPGIFSSQLYLQPLKDQKGHFTNDSFFITCFTTDESIDQLTWTGTDDNEINEEEGRIHIQPTTGTQKGLELVFESVQREDAGTYVCSDTQNSVNFDLIVYKSISFGGTQKVQYAPEGEDTIITCNAKADPSPIVNWYYNGSKLANPQKYKEEEGGLLIYNVNRSDAGYYKCKAFVITNLGSQVKELDIALEVQFAPEVLHTEDSVVYGSFGLEANISCSAFANPDPLFQWVKDGRQIHNSSDHMILSNNKETVLRFKLNDPEQFGEYICEVSNGIGTKEKAIELKEGNTPLAPTMLVIREDQGTLILSLEEAETDDNELTVLGFRVQYIFPTESWNQATTVEFKNGDHFVLRNMSYNSEYLMRASALNAAGYSDYSEIIKYLTHTFQVAPVVADDAMSISLSSLAFLLSAAVLWLY